MTESRPLFNGTYDDDSLSLLCDPLYPFDGDIFEEPYNLFDAPPLLDIRPTYWDSAPDTEMPND